MDALRFGVKTFGALMFFKGFVSVRLTSEGGARSQITRELGL